MEIRAYREDTDREGCLAVWDSNVPEFLDAERRGKFAEFLRDPAAVCFVMEHDGAIIGAGGYAKTGQDSIRLRFGTIRRDLQRQGLGRFLLLYRLKAIGSLAGVVFVEAEVPEALVRFYEKNGLKPQHRLEGGTVVCRMKLQVCAG
jgi:GNAT superfamily N-acetyltransferase